MIRVTCLAWSVEQLGPVEKVLAVIGGGALGGLLVGVVAQLLSRGMTAQRLPRWPLNIIRLLGAVAAGWAVALWVFGVGGPGVGGPGGPGFGGGSGNGETKKPKEDKPKDGTGGREPVPAGEELRVEVLGDDALAKITGLSRGDPKFDREHRYRIAPSGKKLLTLKEVEEGITPDRKQPSPYRRVVIVLYKESPGPGSDAVKGLEDYAKNVPAKGGGKMSVPVELRSAEGTPIR